MFQRYRRWSKAGRFARIFAAISGEADREYAMIDGSIVKVHRHGQGGKGTLNQTIGKSKGGMTTKILALVDALGKSGGIPSATRSTP